jgi:hypothetical protein
MINRLRDLRRRIDQWPRLLRPEVGLVIVAPLVGLLVFTVVVRGGLGSFPIQNLVLYQGNQAYFSLVSMALYYLKHRNNILGVSGAIFIGLLTSVPIIYYLIALNGSPRSVLISLIFAFASIATIVNIAIGKRRQFLWFQLAASAILPLSIIANRYLFAIAITGVAIYVYVNVRHHIGRFGMFSFPELGWSAGLALLTQAPLVTFPVCDNLLTKLIDHKQYLTYILAFKYSAGCINLIFSYFQYRVLFGNEDEAVTINPLHIAAVVILSFAGLWVAQWSLVPMVVLLVYALNISSLYVRNMIRKQTRWTHAVYGMVAISLYAITLTRSPSWLSHQGTFLFLLTACVCLPPILMWAETLVQGSFARSQTL